MADKDFAYHIIKDPGTVTARTSGLASAPVLESTGLSSIDDAFGTYLLHSTPTALNSAAGLLTGLNVLAAGWRPAIEFEVKAPRRGGSRGWLTPWAPGGTGGTIKPQGESRRCDMKRRLLSEVVGILGLPCLMTTAHAQQPLYVLPGSEADDLAGWSVCGGNDVDGDGFPDLIVGAPSYYPLGKTGEAYVFSGKTGALIYTFQGEGIDDKFGSAVSAADVNGDGYADPIVGAPNALVTGIVYGKVYVHSGKDGTLLHLLTADSGGTNDYFGWSVSGGGDVDGDGFEDLVVGSPGDYSGGIWGSAKAFSGRSGQMLYAVYGDPSGGGFGFAVAFVGDLDGDGKDDFVVGNEQDSTNGLSSGSVRAVSGMDGTTLYTLVGENGTMFGSSLAGLGAVDGDATPDFAVGVLQDDLPNTVSGSVAVVSGKTGTILFKVFGENNFERLGAAVAGLGDFDGDGVPDFVASPWYVEQFPLARVYSGAGGAKLLVLNGAAGIDFGSSVAGMGDLNGDGLGDVAVGAPLEGLSGAYSGSARVYLAGCTTLTPYCTAKANSLGCSPEVDAGGVASLSVGDNFVILASRVVNQQLGILVWSLSSDAKPFFGGILCLGSPVIRTAAQLSGGNPPPADCSGTFGFHFSPAYMAQQALVAGTTVYAQYWYRDPAHPDGTRVGLSNALAFPVCN